MAKTATIFHPAPTKGVTLCLLPYGAFANVPLQKVEIGGTLIFCDAWRKEKFRLVRRTKLAVRSGAFNLLCKALYGEHATFETLLERWQGVAVSEGWGKSAFDPDTVMLIQIEKLDG